MNATPGAVRGARGEAIAALWLEARGYTIVARNLRRGRREIDLVAARGATLVAVEVKWRQAGDARAAGAWSPAQRRRQAEAVLLLLADLPGAAGRPFRFDLVTIEECASGFTLVHRRGAWSPGGSWW